jgi:DegV family protein with EDD domain
MEKIAIMTCGTSGIDYLDGYDDILLGRTTITIDGIEYLDGVDIHPQEFYDQLNDYVEIPQTAQPSTAQLLDKYEILAKEGYTDIIYISISEELSGTFQGVHVSKTLVDNINIHPFNSGTASYITGFMATEAHRMAAEGKSVEEIFVYLEKLKANDRIVFMVDDLKYLVKSGRLSNSSAFLASMLKIKPVLEVAEEGKIVGLDKIRTSKKAIDKVIKSYLEDTNNGKNAKYTFFFNTDAPKHIKYVKEQLEAIGIDTKDIWDAPISPAVGCHVGKGVIGIGYIKDFE